MKLSEARALAVGYMKLHGLEEKGWRFKFDNAKRRFGLCSGRRKVISLSRYLVELNDGEEVRDTILHEIAHALVPGDGHGPKWKAVAKGIGAKPQRCYDSARVASPEGKIVGTCPRCGKETRRFKRPTVLRACGRCCKEFNRGKYSDLFAFVWRDERTGEVLDIEKPRPRRRRRRRRVSLGIGYLDINGTVRT
jgi:predicted SprT family Zn-dependent metalloprotease